MYSFPCFCIFGSSNYRNSFCNQLQKTKTCLTNILANTCGRRCGPPWTTLLDTDSRSELCPGLTMCLGIRWQIIEKVTKWPEEEIVLEIKLLEGGSPRGHSGHLHQLLGLWNRPALLHRWESPTEGNSFSQCIWFSAENLNFTYSFSNVEDGKLFWAKTRHRCIDLNCFELVKIQILSPLHWYLQVNGVTLRQTRLGQGWWLRSANWIIGKCKLIFPSSEKILNDCLMFRLLGEKWTLSSATCSSPISGANIEHQYWHILSCIFVY